jgi:glycine betaine/proline transport system ATP-binding protein
LRLADRIAIMKDGVIEQLDTPANIVLHPATEYVRKFTEEVPREKVLKIEAVMDAANADDSMGDLSVNADAIIEQVAESILNSNAPVRVVDDEGQTVGSITAAKIVHVLFGDHATKPSETTS